MFDLYLQDFLHPVPTCLIETRLKTLLDWIDQQPPFPDRETGMLPSGLVLVDQQQRPLGLINAWQLLRLLLPAPDRSPYLEYSLAELLGLGPPETTPVLSAAIASRLLIPLTTLPASFTLTEFLRQPFTNTEQGWAIVNPKGEYLGLLDPVGILAQQQAVPRSTSPSELAALELEPLPDQPQDLAALPLLNQLIAVLPLPLMLQTNAGQVVSCNLLWQQQMTPWFHPQQLKQDIRQRLGSSCPLAGVCEWESRLDTFVCRYTLQDDQGRSWQVSAVPLPFAAPAQRQSEIEKLLLATLVGDSLGEKRFATLQPQPAPATYPNRPSETSDWLWLIWTEAITSSSPWEALGKRSETITHQQSLESLQAENTRLIRLNQLKDELFADISHELKTPLTAVLGLAGVLQSQGLGALNPRQEHYVQLIHQSGRQLTALVNDVVDLLQMETGQLELLPEAIQLHPLCERAYELALGLIQSPTADPVLAMKPQGWKFELDIAPEMDRLWADPLRLRQMLVHLLTHALQFTPPDKPLGLRVRTWQDWIAFTVWNRGMGIPQQCQQLLFEQLQRWDIHQNRNPDLGLMLTRKLAQLHGGDVSFISQEGWGSEFTLLLPHSNPCSSPAESDALRSPLVISPANREERWQLCLIASVSPWQQDLAAKLESLNYGVVVAHSGLEAIAKARQLKPQLIFLNPTLPSLSGWDVLSLLKFDPITASIPVIMTVATEVAQADHQGAEAFLRLPIATELLAQTLTRLVGDAIHGPFDSVSLLPQAAIASPPEEMPALKNLTVLRLGCNRVPHLPYCRVLEADDLEQAELLARIWQPQVLLWDWVTTDPLAEFQQLSHHRILATLPLVTLDRISTCAANQVPGLVVFPCLCCDPEPSEDRSQEATTLWQVLQVAAGRF